MKSFFFVFFLFLSTVGGYSQKLSHQVLVPAAGLTTIGDISYQQTIGETAVETFILSPYVLTQGFQQPSVLGEDEKPDPTGSGITVRPNPVTSDRENKLFVKIDCLETRSYIIRIYNFAGSVVYSWHSDTMLDYEYNHEVNMEYYSRGIYFVWVTSTDGEVDLSFKIEKL